MLTSYMTEEKRKNVELDGGYVEKCLNSNKWKIRYPLYIKYYAINYEKIFLKTDKNVIVLSDLNINENIIVKKFYGDEIEITIEVNMKEIDTLDNGKILKISFDNKLYQIKKINKLRNFIIFSKIT